MGAWGREDGFGSGIAAGLGLKGYITSPTYLIIKEHRGRYPFIIWMPIGWRVRRNWKNWVMRNIFWEGVRHRMGGPDPALLPPEYLRLGYGRWDGG